ncbi:MAG: histidine kinase [Verrucomicrobia bacterium]|nr:MAG: histidine kinase [Verrucomicrobiota bacterium]
MAVRLALERRETFMLRILHVEDQDADAWLLEHAITTEKIDASFTRVSSRAEYLAALEKGGFDLILADSGLPGFDRTEAMELARSRIPDIPLIAVSGAVTDSRAAAMLKAGAANCVSKDHRWQLIAAGGMSRLVSAVQELSLARDLDTIMAIVRCAARELTGADGATFVLRDGEFCYYADENAIAPLWKGQRFPLQICISGWAMLNRQPAVIEDIYADPRVPTDAYRPTFVKSLAMVPIRTEDPIGAIGNYWARQRMPTSAEVELLQALANTTAVAMENVQVYGQLEQRVKDRTAELEAANRELESFSSAVSHDLRAPLRSIRAFSDIVLEDSGDRLDAEGKRHLQTIRASGRHMAELIEDLLRLARFSKASLNRTTVNLSGLAKEIVSRLSAASPERQVEVRIADAMEVEADAGLVGAALENLLANAWKYTSKSAQPRVEFGSTAHADGSAVYFVRDNGAGFEMKYAPKLFQPFQRLHSEADFPGTGIGLATVQRIINRHGGRIWAEAEPNQGATFYFTLGNSKQA